jgi:hypothetical protein
MAVVSWSMSWRVRMSSDVTTSEALAQPWPTLLSVLCSAVAVVVIVEEAVTVATAATMKTASTGSRQTADSRGWPVYRM